MAKTATISAKVAPDIASALKRQALAADTTVSAIISQMVTRVEPKQVVASVKAAASVPKAYSNELVDIAALVGGSSMVGILCYSGSKAVLVDAVDSNKLDYTPEQIEFIAGAIGVCASILTGIGIHKALKK